jgi:parallel beta-helix repeat protein
LKPSLAANVRQAVRTGIAFIGCLLMANPLSALDIYVSANGNDAWSGKLDKANSKGTDGPVATIAAAIEKARVARKQLAQPETIHIQVRKGNYELVTPIVLTAEDSGMNAKNSFYLEAYRGEQPVISGGRQITGWQRMANRPGAWQVQLPEVAEGKWYFRQLFIDGQRKQRARSPKAGSYYRVQGPSSQEKPARLKFHSNEVAQAWETMGDVEAVLLPKWAPARMQIRKVDEANKVAVLAGALRESNKEDNTRYYIENFPEALDEPGEWYLNRRNGNLTYLAEPGKDLSRATAVAPRLEELLQLKGETDKPVRHVVIRGLTFSHTDWALPDDGFPDTQAAVRISGEVRAEHAEECIFENCTFSHLGGYALELGAGCRKIEVIGNRMFDLGAGGIRIGTQEIPKEPGNATGGNTIANNLIHHGGQVYQSAIGVLILQSGENRIAHNEIHHLYYTAISVGWTWGYRDSPCHGNIIEFNYLHDIGQGLLSDMGGVYLLGPQKGTVVRNNLIHDVDAANYGGWGLYTDEGSSFIVLENNVVYRCKHAGFHQHYGRENIVRNNIFAFGKEHQLMRSREETHTSFYFTNNIVYFDSGDLLGSYWSNDQFVTDNNLYYDQRAKSTEGLKFAGKTWEEWHQKGHDQHSIYADPKFMEPKKADFRLKSDSPAHRLGFQDIDVSRCGLEKSYRKGAD